MTATCRRWSVGVGAKDTIEELGGGTAKRPGEAGNVQQRHAQQCTTIDRVLTDNGGSYCSFLFQTIANEHAIALQTTRPCRPQTNAKAEAFNKTLQRERVYLRPYSSNQERATALQPVPR